MKRSSLMWVLSAAALALSPVTTMAALTSQDQQTSPAIRALASSDVLEAHQYCLPDTLVAGQESLHQQVTIWQVTAGTWNGESLKGLSLVLVKSGPTGSSSSEHELTNCYVSHLATAAQRDALLSAYSASQAIAPSEKAAWHVEPAVIRFEYAGQTIVVHLGLVA